MILLEDKEIEQLLGHAVGLYSLWPKVALAQHIAGVAWLTGVCPHSVTDTPDMGHNHWMQRRACPLCWAEFVSAGKE